MKTKTMTGNSFKKALSVVLCTVMLCGMLPLSPQRASADENIIEISTAEELASLSKRCKLDTWSVGKTVVLKSDIDLTGSDFVSIPTFGGVFLGGGYTISGLEIDEGFSHIGLFRYIQKGAAVSDLNVTGVVEPGTSKEFVGGIVGTNSGSITNCTFGGAVSGKNNVGAIAGSNETSGVITGCRSMGTVDAEHFVGGIVGQNEGSVVGCSNESHVCTSSQDSRLTLDELSLDLDKINSTENLAALTDIGGIAGFSSGVLQSCGNSATIGYQHTGYNIGGIAGRQSGQISDCKNHGEIFGRKDVGGIVGQMEPFLVLDFSKDTVQKLDERFDSLESSINGVLDTANGYSDSISSKLTGLRDTANGLRDEAHNIADKTTDFADGTVDTVNDVSARFVRVMEQTDAVLDSGRAASDSLKSASDSLKNSISFLKDASENMTTAMEKLDPAFDELDEACESTSDALDSASGAMDDLTNALGDTEKLQNAVGDLSDSVSTAADSIGKMGDTIDNIADILDDMNSSPELEAFRDDMEDGVSRLGKSLKDMSGAMSDISDGIDGIKKQINSDSLELAKSGLLQSVDSLSSAMTQTSMALSDISEAMKKIKSASGNTSESFDKCLAAVSSLSENMKTTAQTAKTAAEYLKGCDIPLGAEQTAQMRDYISEISSSFSDAHKDVSRITMYALSVVQSFDPAAAKGAYDDLISAASSLSGAANQFRSAFKSISQAIKDLKASVGNEQKFKAAVKAVRTALDDASEAVFDLGDSLYDMANACKTLQKTGYLDDTFDDIINQLESMGDALKTAKDALSGMSQAAGTINDETDLGSLKDGFSKLSDSLAKLSSAISSLKGASSAMNDAWPNVTAASEELTNALKEARDASGFASDSAGQLSATIDNIRAIVDEFNAKGDIVFQNLGSGYTESVDNMFELISELSDKAKGLSDEVGNAGDDLFSDLRDISSKASDVISTLMDAYRDSVSGEDKSIFEDISDSDSSESRHGTVLRCANYANVNGDLNVGGNAGTMSIEYDFDPEDDVVNSGSNSLNFKYQTMAVLRDSTNRGKVTSKKNCAGGNVGMMNLGTVLLCKSFGKVESTDGDYVGGIAGKSDSTVRKSYSMCPLSGRDYVGGIVGEGGKVSDCLALVDIEKASEYIGSIAGNLTDTAQNNFFVGTDFGGIDDISYTGSAEPCEYSAFITFDGIPEDFKHFELNFVADGSVVDTISFAYGDNLSYMSLPLVPEKEGCYGRWSDVDYTDLRFSKTIEAVYTPFVTTLSSSLMRESKCIFLAEGHFGNTARLSVRASEYKGKLPCSKDSVLESWDIELVDDFDSASNDHRIRFLPPETKRDVRVFVLEKNQWRKADCQKDGSYLVFDVTTEKPTVVIAKAKTNIAATVIIVLIVIALFVLFAVRTKKGKSVVARLHAQRAVKASGETAKKDSKEAD